MTTVIYLVLYYYYRFFCFVYSSWNDYFMPTKTKAASNTTDRPVTVALLTLNHFYFMALFCNEKFSDRFLLLQKNKGFERCSNILFPCAQALDSLHAVVCTFRRFLHLRENKNSPDRKRHLLWHIPAHLLLPAHLRRRHSEVAPLLVSVLALLSPSTNHNTPFICRPMHISLPLLTYLTDTYL